jgi:hypothetical protein
MTKTISLLILTVCLFSNLVVSDLECEGSLVLETVGATTYTTSSLDIFKGQKKAGQQVCLLCVKYDFELSCEGGYGPKPTVEVVAPESGYMSFYREEATDCKFPPSSNTLKSLAGSMKFDKEMPSYVYITDDRVTFSAPKAVHSSVSHKDKSKGSVITYTATFSLSMGYFWSETKRIRVSLSLGEGPTKFTNQATKEVGPERIIQSKVGSCPERVISNTMIAPKVTVWAYAGPMRQILLV